MPVVDKAAVVGGGIGQTLLQHGYEVTIRDVDEDVLTETETGS